MIKKKTDNRPQIRFVDHLPDLITPEDYRNSTDKKRIRIRIMVTDEGIEVLGDSMYISLLEELFAEMGAEEIEGTLCG